jgi:predicted kinase
MIHDNFPLIIACGLSGSGKTFNSQALVKHFESYVHLNLGDLREELGITSYSRKDTPRLLAKAIEVIEKNHHDNIGTVFDANLKSLDLRQCFYDLAQELGKKVVLIEFFCSEEGTKKRMLERVQLTPVENPKDPQVYYGQKRTWQDTSLDLTFLKNKHLTIIRYDTEREKPLFLNNRHFADENVFVKNLISIFKHKSRTF